MEYQDIINALDQCWTNSEHKKTPSDLVIEILNSIKSCNLSDKERLVVAKKFIYLKQWQLAEISLESVSKKSREQLQLMALLAEGLSNTGLFNETERILSLLPCEIEDEDTALSKIDALNKFIEYCINSKFLEKALEKLKLLEDQLLSMNRIHYEQAELLALAGEFWMNLNKPKKAIRLWKKALVIANNEFEKNRDIGRMRHTIRQTYDAIIISIAKSGGINLAERFINLIKDEVGRKQAFESASKFISFGKEV